MKHCARCLYRENHPLGIIFDAQGVCSGCRVHEEKYTLDWEQRKQQLGDIFDRYRSATGKTYDCIVPVSGARDSYFIVHTVKRVFGMNPLLVSYNRQYNTSRGIRNLAYLRTVFDCDYMQQIASPETIKRVSRETIRRLGSLHWHAIAGQSVWPVQVAVRLKIPLIVWGAHQGLDQVGMFSHADEVEMTRKYRCEHDLMGVEAADLVGGEEGLKEYELRAFSYPHDLDLSKVGVRGVYLGNYIPWDSKRQHEDMHKLYDQEWALQQRTFDTYNDVDCHHYSGLHDWIKYLKWGYGKATDHACREIRLKRMTREEGIEMVKRYSGVDPQDKAAYLEWVGMDEAEFDACIDTRRDPRIWEQMDQGWRLRDAVSLHRDSDAIEAARLGKLENCEFTVTPSKDPSTDEKGHVLMAKGYVSEHPAVNRRAGPEGHPAP